MCMQIGNVGFIDENTYIFDENNIIYHGDCLDFMKSISKNSIDLILTDPPYGTTACLWDTIIPMFKMWDRIKRVIKKNRAICLFGSEPFSSQLRLSNLSMYKYDWLWNKITGTGFLTAKYMPLKQHEIISVFGKSKINYYPVMVKMDKPDSYKCYGSSDLLGNQKNDGKRRVRTHKYPKTIITVSNASKKNKVHPTQKPVELLEYLIKTYTLEGDTVLDFTMGSGSTGVACVNTNRKFIGIELDEKYFSIAKDRIQDALHARQC